MTAEKKCVLCNRGVHRFLAIKYRRALQVVCLPCSKKIYDAYLCDSIGAVP